MRRKPFKKKKRRKKPFKAGLGLYINTKEI